MSDSIWNDPRITAYVLEELSADDRQAFEHELESNAELRAAVSEARGVTGQLEGLFAAEPIPVLEQQRRQQIVSTSPAATGSWRIPLVALATAASLMLIVAGPMWWNRDREMLIGQAADEPGQAAAESKLLERAVDGSAVADHEGQSMAPAEQVPTATASTSAQEPNIGIQSDLAEAAGATEAEQVPLIAQGSGAGTRLERRRQFTPEGMPVQADTPRVASSNRLRELTESPSALPPRKPTAGKTTADIATAAASPPPEAESVESYRRQPSTPPLPTAAQPSVTLGFDGVAGFDDTGVSNGSFGLAPPSPEALPNESQRSRIQLGGPVNPDSADRRLGFNVLIEGERERFGFEDAGDRFQPITDNPFQRVSEHSLSTFSIDVDTASYSKTRDFLLRAHQLPSPHAVRIEELVNYFHYAYDPPAADSADPFSTDTVVTSCPWNREHRLVRVALKGKVMEKQERPPCNLVFLLDTSGSMKQPNKLPLVVEGMQMLLKQLDPQDRVAITVYAGSAGLVLDSTPAKKKKKIRKALTALSAGGSTNGGAGIALAYQTARDHFIKEGVNRVILCTDGDFNVGTTGTDELVRMVEQQAQGGIFLSVLGFGMGNHNDAMLEQISGRGNGNYAFIDNRNEAHKVLVQQTSATLVTIAKDVKLQVEFNPKEVSSYRLIGYENRVLEKEDFNDDQKDAGEIGAGHAVTALYEIVPAGVDVEEIRPAVDSLKYQSSGETTDAADSGELMTLKLRYKEPDGETSKLLEFAIKDEGMKFTEADEDVRFAAAVAGFGMQLRRSEFKGDWTLSDVQRVAESALGDDEQGLRKEFIQLVRQASELMGQE